MGSGKTTLLGEASDILAAHGVRHAAIDLDAVNAAGLPDDASADLTVRNLAALGANFAAAGIERILLAEAVDSRERLERIRSALGGATIVVCRLTAELETLQARIRQREPGMLQQQFVHRAGELDARLDRAGVEDFVVANGSRRSITDVAREVLIRAGWLENDAAWLAGR
jgi:hypothetical protein